MRPGVTFCDHRAVRPAVLISVGDGRIAAVEPGTASAPEGSEVLEVPGGTILPGLIDAHVHLCADVTEGTLDRIGEPGRDDMMAVIEQSLHETWRPESQRSATSGTAATPCSTGAHPLGNAARIRMS